eukprot:1179413-Prorocentrum_minimum.AAC.3
MSGPEFRPHPDICRINVGVRPTPPFLTPTSGQRIQEIFTDTRKIVILLTHSSLFNYTDPAARAAEHGGGEERVTIKILTHSSLFNYTDPAVRAAEHGGGEERVPQ